MAKTFSLEPLEDRIVVKPSEEEQTTVSGIVDQGNRSCASDLAIVAHAVLRHPLLALDLIHEHATRDLFIFQSMQRGSEEVEPLAEDYPFWETNIFQEEGFPKAYFIEKSYSNDQTNWWIPNRTAVEAMLRSSGLELLAHPESETWLCAPRSVQRDGRYILDMELDGTL